MSATELGEHLDQEETQVEKFLSGKKLYLTGTFILIRFFQPSQFIMIIFYFFCGH